MLKFQSEQKVYLRSVVLTVRLNVERANKNKVHINCIDSSKKGRIEQTKAKNKSGTQLKQKNHTKIRLTSFEE